VLSTTSISVIMKRLFTKLPVLLLSVLSAVSAQAQIANPNVHQNNLKATVCQPGWSAKVRPPTSYTTPIKRRLMAEQGIPAADANLYELDHIWPISSGGSPSDKRNLMLQPWAGVNGAKAKDIVEGRTQAALCSGKATLQQVAQCYSSPDAWITCPVGKAK
jgi:hypothetical protein